MPLGDIITLEVPSLIMSSDQDVHSAGISFISFVRGNYELMLPNQRKPGLQRSIGIGCTIHLSAKPKYDWNGNDDNTPACLKVVSWMDWANSQLRLIISEENMKIEQKLNIACCKHSAASTRPMFKLMKQMVRDRDIQHAAYNSIFNIFSNQINALQCSSVHLSQSTKVLNLVNHKKESYFSNSS